MNRVSKFGSLFQIVMIFLFVTVAFATPPAATVEHKSKAKAKTTENGTGNEPRKFNVCAPEKGGRLLCDGEWLLNCAGGENTLRYYTDVSLVDGNFKGTQTNDGVATSIRLACGVASSNVGFSSMK